MDEERREEQEVQQPEVLVGNTENTSHTTNTTYTQTTTTDTKGDTKGFGIAAMVLGILSLIICCFWQYSITFAVIAIVLGIIGVKKPGKGMAIAGIITGAIGFIFSIIAIVIFLIIGVSGTLAQVIGTELEDISDTVYNTYYDFEYPDYNDYNDYNDYDWDYDYFE